MRMATTSMAISRRITSTRRMTAKSLTSTTMASISTRLAGSSEDDMVDVNRLTTPANTRWKLIDRSDDAENHAISWRFRVGDRVKIRLVNEMDSDHPM